jgi:uncharacterized membrane protein (UPF0127 family)
MVLATCALTGCSREEGNRPMPIAERFAHLEKVDLVVAGTTVRAWIARSGNDVEHGLMHVSADDMKPYPDGARKGMFFFFERQRSRYEGFWMKDVPIPLDIAFLRADGTVVTVETMAPFDLRSTVADGPYQFTLEVSGGLLKKLGLKKGDVIAIPESILNSGS